MFNFHFSFTLQCPKRLPYACLLFKLFLVPGWRRYQWDWFVNDRKTVDRIFIYRFPGLQVSHPNYPFSNVDYLDAWRLFVPVHQQNPFPALKGFHLSLLDNTCPTLIISGEHNNTMLRSIKESKNISLNVLISFLNILIKAFNPSLKLFICLNMSFSPRFFLFLDENLINKKSFEQFIT